MTWTFRPLGEWACYTERFGEWEYNVEKEAADNSPSAALARLATGKDSKASVSRTAGRKFLFLIVRWFVKPMGAPRAATENSELTAADTFTETPRISVEASYFLS